MFFASNISQMCKNRIAQAKMIVIRMMLLITCCSGLQAEGISFPKWFMPGIAVTPQVTYSDERQLGFGVDATAFIAVFDFSWDLRIHEREFNDRKQVSTGYMGLGVGNLIMAQYGYNEDGSVFRLHGDLGLYNLWHGELPYFREQEKDTGYILKDVIMSYSLGVERAGYFFSVGFGIGY